jgi:glutamyl-tRNA synthetase
MADIKKSIEKHALANAVLHKGKAQPGAIVGKILAEDPKAKANMKEIMPHIHKTVQEVNKLPVEKQKSLLKRIWPKFFNREKQVKGLSELPGAVDGKVVTRFPPEPGKYMTVGHATSFLINYIYAQKYKGKCVLRFEDTNAEKANQEAVDSFLDSTKRFLDIKTSKIVYISDDILKLYTELEKLLNKKQAYVCSCSAGHISKLRRKRKACEHRDQTVKQNLELWKQMLNGKEGLAVRLMGKMDSNNAVLRDPVIARTNKINHYRHKKKYSVWPTYDFANTCEDEWCGITHILRGIEFGNERIELQKFIASLLGFKDKYYIQYGRINVSGLEKSSGRVLRNLVEKGGRWDDPRMPTIIALERRGFVKETFYELAKQVGLSKTPTKVDEQTIAAINRKIIDPIVNRFFFVANPVKVHIDNMPKIKTAKLQIHPDKTGTRDIKVSKAIFIDKKDLINNLKLEVRLKGLCNAQIPAKPGVIHKKILCTGATPKYNLQVIQWVPKDHVKVDVLMTNGKIIHGIAETNVKDLKEGTIVQFERFGFCRLDKKEKDKLTFVWGHQ